MLLLTKGADVTARTKGGVSALSFIVRRTPDVIPQFVSRLDEAIALHDHELGDVDCELRLDYRPLVPGGRGESDLMLCLVEVGQRHILKHPLCESFLHLKWLKIRKFFLFSLIFHSIFVAVFTGYIIVTFLPSLNNPHLSQLFFWFVLMFTLILAFKEIFQVAHGIWVYAKGWENVLQWSVILTSAMVLSRPVSDWQHHVAALGSLFVWLELMMVVGRFPMFGIFVQMFTQVTINFLKFVGAYLCPIVGFSLAFCVLHTNYNPFKNPLVGLLKTIIMLSGELEFEDIFFDDKMENHDRKIKDLEDKNLTGEDFGEPILYAGTSHCMFLAFVILVTVILANLMMGLAVSDIQELRRNAGLDRLVRRAELVAHLESLLFSKLLDYAPKKILKACRSSALLLHLPHHCAIHIRPNDPREKRFPKEIIKSIYRLVSGKKTKAKSFGNNSVNSSNDNGFGSNRIRRLYSTSSFNDSCQHFSDLAIEFKKFSLNIESRLDTLTVKVDTIAKEINSITSYQKRNK